MKIKILILLLILSSCKKGIDKDELIAVSDLSTFRGVYLNTYIC
jgi:Tfp pilus assembly protein PilP